MRSLKLDFLHPQPTAAWPAWLLLIAGLALAGWAVVHDGQLKQELAAETAEQRRLGKSPLARNAGQAGTPMADEQLLLPWNELFSKLESVKTKDIALISLEADGRKTEAILTAEARSFNNMLAYVESLRNEAGFKSVTLSSHVLREEDPQQPYRFVLRLGWRS